MKKILLGILTVLMVMTCFGCGKPEEPVIDETPLIDILKGIEPSTVGFYVIGEEGNINECQDAEYIVFNPVKTAEDAAINNLKNTMRWGDLTVKNEDSLINGFMELVADSEVQRVLVINDAYIDALKSNELTAQYTENLISISNYDEETAYDFSLAENPFQVAIYGEDTRGEEIIYNSRYDTDLLVTVNPLTKQVLIVSIPRDGYVKNFAHGEDYDKLTHLGDDGPENALAGLSDLFGTKIGLYVLTNFVEFKKLIDHLGGLDIYNPYTFKLKNGGKGTFKKGNLHLSGEKALSYSRERFTLTNGDLDRCSHNVILLKGILDKIISLDTLFNFDEMINRIQSCFFTNVSLKQMYGLAVMQYLDKPDWNIVSYRIWADYENRDTATYKDQGKLTCAILYQPDIDYVITEMNKVMNGEVITQGTLPSE